MISPTPPTTAPAHRPGPAPQGAALAGGAAPTATELASIAEASDALEQTPLWVAERALRQGVARTPGHVDASDKPELKRPAAPLPDGDEPQAELLRHLEVYLRTARKQSIESGAKRAERLRELNESREAQRIKEMEAAEEAQRKVSWISKIFSWIVKTVLPLLQVISVTCACFTGGLSLIVNLAIAAFMVICALVEHFTGFSILGEIMKPITKGIMEMIKAIANELVKTGMSPQAAQIVAAIITVVVIAVAMYVCKKAASALIKKLFPNLEKMFAENLKGLFQGRFAKLAAGIDTAATLGETGAIISNGAGGVAAARYQEISAEHQTKVLTLEADWEIINQEQKDVWKNVLDSNKKVNVLAESLSQMIKNTMDTANEMSMNLRPS